MTFNTAERVTKLMLILHYIILFTVPVLTIGGGGEGDLVRVRGGLAWLFLILVLHVGYVILCVRYKGRLLDMSLEQFGLTLVVPYLPLLGIGLISNKYNIDVFYLVLHFIPPLIAVLMFKLDAKYFRVVVKRIN